MGIKEEDKKLYRFLEAVPGVLSWLTLIMPFVLAPFFPTFVAYFILIYSLYFFFKVILYSYHLYFGFKRMKKYEKIDWYKKCKKLKNIESVMSELKKKNDKECFYDLVELSKVKDNPGLFRKIDNIHHVVVLAIYKESFDIVEPSILAILNNNFPNDKVSIVLACEGREQDAKKIGKALKEKYEKHFHYFEYFVHPDNLPNEIKGKGPNITYAGKKYKEYLDKNKISYEDILVTNLDGDHILHKEYLGRVTYRYMIDPNRSKKTYQPISLLVNNIWDTPALNRIAAISSSYWQIIESLRPHRIRTFAAHTQSFETLIKTNFWATHSIVEDGHQFWRTYFAFEGNMQMVPLFIPVYQDAVLLDTYMGTLKGQYLQMRRWAWGASDFPYIVLKFKELKNIPLYEKIVQTFRQFSGNYSWATSSFLFAGAWIPLLFNRAFQETMLAHNVTTYTTFVMRLAWLNILLSAFIFLSLLPPKPERHSPKRFIGMVLQWVLLPISTIFLSSLPALDSQTRLILGKRLEFWTTPKVRKDGVQTLPNLNNKIPKIKKPA